VKRTLNDRIVKALKPAATGQRVDHMDTIVPGFGVRVTDRGVKTYILIARFPGSANPTRRALGGGELTLERARAKARDWLDLIRRGIDPREQEERQRLAEQRKRANSFAALAQDFIEQKLPSERRGAEVEKDIRRELIPAWGGRPVTEITADDVKALVKQIKVRGPGQARNVLGHVRRMLNWAIDQGDYGLTSSPCDRLKPKVLIGEKKVRTRVLNDVELRAVWQAAGRLGYPYCPAIRLLIVTGQRKSEVAEATWREIDLAKKLWTIGPERMKSGAAHEVPLTDAAIMILKSLPRFERGDHLFSADFGVSAVNGFARAKTRIDRETLTELKAAGIETMRPWVFHDLRRTMRTGLSALPVPDLVRELVIAHSVGGLHKVYDQHSYREEKRQALDLWAAHLRDVVTPAPANVTELRSAR